MSSDRALAIAAIRRFIYTEYATALPTWRFEIYFYVRGDIECRLVAPFESQSALGEIYLSIPSPYVRLRKTWRASVHEHGLDHLPPSPTSRDVFVLHAEEHHIFNGIGTATAVWTTGGRKVVHGHLAWRPDEFDTRSVAAWAVGTTEARALKKLVGWPTTLRVHRDDADAFGEILL